MLWGWRSCFFIQIKFNLSLCLDWSQVLGNSMSGLLGLLTRVMGRSWGPYPQKNISKGEKQPGFCSLFVMCVSKNHMFPWGSASLWTKAWDPGDIHYLISPARSPRRSQALTLAQPRQLFSCSKLLLCALGTLSSWPASLTQFSKWDPGWLWRE